MNQKLIYKYLNGESSEEETRSLLEMAERSEPFRKELIRLKKAWALHASLEADTQAAWRQVRESVASEDMSARRLRTSNYYRYAAVVLMVLSTSALLWQFLPKPPKPQSGPEEITLTIGSQQWVIPSGKQDAAPALTAHPSLNFQDTILSYQAASNPEKTEMHTLTVPKGKTFHLKLEDGSSVTLNAESSLTYPSHFNGMNREVSLSGEAYFEVARDSSRPFKVASEALQVAVLGTEFNLRSYPGEATHSASLFEGKVLVQIRNNANSSLELDPGHGVTFNSATGSFTQNLVSRNREASWINGELTMQEASAAELFRELERRFAISIDNQYPEMNARHFSGTFNIKGKKIDDILNLIRLDTDFRFTRKGSVVIIQPPIINPKH